jgi:DnaJ-class molecular chaperone
MGTHTYTSEQLLEECQMWRGVEPEHACKGCGGSGTKAYGDTSTWRGGVGGQMITSGPCDKCWGSGDEYRKWPSHRRMAALESEVARLRATYIDLKTD